MVGNAFTTQMLRDAHAMWALEAAVLCHCGAMLEARDAEILFQ